jgi:SulP family sulfate permease
MANVAQKLVSELRADLLSAKAIPALSAGFTSGLGLLVAQIAFGSLIFSGALAPWSSQGIGLVLFGNFATCLIFALASGFRGVIAGLSPALVIVMANVGASMRAEGEALFVTAAGALIICALVIGASCYLLGRFRLTNLVRFIPYPVTAGFVGGIGAAVCLGAMSLMGAAPEWRTLPALLEPAVLWRWGPGVAYGIGLYVAMKRWGNPLILPVSVVVMVGIFHVVLAATGGTADEARAAGDLLTSTAEGGLWPSLGLADLAAVEWAAMAAQIPHMLTLIVVAFICVVMNVAGLELATGEELDWDREFRVTGAASAVAGVGGGTVATIVVPASLRSPLLGASTRLTGVVSALVLAVALFLGDGMLQIVPSRLVGGILVFAGLGMLDQGLVKSRKRLPWSEYGIIVLIVIVIVGFGMIEGVAVGMLATLAFFAVRLSRVDPIQSRFTARERRSNKVRPVPDRAILVEEGERVHAYRLRGYLFFGSAARLADRLRQSLRDAAHPPACILLDFAAVSGFDVSAVTVMARFVQAAHAAKVPVVLSGVSESLEDGLQRTLPPVAAAGLLVEPSVDRALEHCEDLVIAAWKADVARVDERRAELLDHSAAELEHYLERQIRFEDLLEELPDWVEQRRYATAELLADANAPHDGLQLLVSGSASGCDAAGNRLFQRGRGDVIWPAALDQEAASVVAEELCRTLFLTPEARSRLEEQNQALALTLYRYLLGGRLVGAPASDAEA